MASAAIIWWLLAASECDASEQAISVASGTGRRCCRGRSTRTVQAAPKTSGPLRLTAHVFKTPEPIGMILADLNVTQSGATWRNSATQISLSATTTYENCNINCWAEAVWTCCWIKSTAAVYQRRENRGRPRSAWTATNVVLVADLICSEAWWESLAGVSEWWRRLKCVLQQNGGHVEVK